jgi:pimeloyl-ACP methyl ester carboxylesterase
MTSIYRSAAGELMIREWCRDQLEAWPVDHVSRLVHAAGSDTHLLVAGDGPVTVVSIAGDRFNAATSLPLLTVLAPRFRVVAADVPGQPGLSADHPGGAPTPDWYAAWLNDVVEQVESDTCLLVGHSFGGAVVLACSSPRVAGRLAVSTAGLCRLRLTPSLLAAFVAWTARPRPSTSGRLLRRLMGPDHSPRPELVAWMTLVAQHTRPVSTSDIVSPSRDIPTIVATGDADVFLPPARLRPAVRAALGSELQVIAGAGHLATDERPEDVLNLLELLS